MLLKNNHIEMVYFLASNSYDYFIKCAMTYAAMNNHIDSVLFYISKGADNWNNAMVKAARNNHRE